MPSPDDDAWLKDLLARNRHCAYLRAFGSPTDVEGFRSRVPIVTYEALARDWLERVAVGEPDVLFVGRPCAYERTGGSSGGAKLIPYSAEGLADFRAAVVPWLADAVARFRIEGGVYFSISPATRPPETVAGVAVGLPDGAYLGEEWGGWLAAHHAVPLDVTMEPQVDAWRRRTIEALSRARDLQMISVWSPTFLARLLDDLGDPRELWPDLRLVSCWADAASRGPFDELRRRLPQARFQAKGLLSTECVVTVPDAQDRPVLSRHGFFEFERDGIVCLPHELMPDADYEVIATTASGLYRYRTGDTVRCGGFASQGRPILEFRGRRGIVSDLVGEKLEEAFVDEALRGLQGFRFLAPAPGARGYVLVTDHADPAADVPAVEERLARNPQYAYARRIGQLEPLRVLRTDRLFDRYVAHQVSRGMRMGDVKPLALVRDTSWITDGNPA